MAVDRHPGFPNFEKKTYIRLSLLSDLAPWYNITRKSDNPLMSFCQKKKRKHGVRLPSLL